MPKTSSTSADSSASSNTSASPSSSVAALQFGQARFPTAEFMRPEAVVEHLGINTGMNVADLGSGNGYMTIPAARLVGASGLVYAVDVLKDKLQHIKGQAQLFGFAQVITSWADLEVPGSTKIADESIDVTLIFNSLFQIQKRDVVLKEAKRITKKGGIIAVTEWAKKKYGFGPEQQMLVSDEEIKDLAKKIGLMLKEEHEADDFHYLLEFIRP